MSKVAMSACADYQPQNVQTAVSDVLAQLGGLQNFVKPDQKVFIKVNLVREMSPDKHGTTHPEAVIALVNELSKITQNIIVGDSCGGMYTKGVMNVVYNKCKMTEIANRTCAKLNDDFDFQTVELDGKSLQKCEIINAFTSADVVINFTKLKTHSFAGYTGAVKNLYGLIPGLLKVELHSRFPDLGDFCNLLCDIEQYAKSKIVLHMIDGVIGMEGAGPTNGKPKFIGQILASPNPYELDVVAVSLFGKPFDMPLLQVARERGLVSDDLDTIDFDFATLEDKFVDNFDIPEVTSANTFLNMPKWVKKLAKKYLTKKVKIDKNRCRGCGKCVTHCPAQALQVVDKKAKLKQSKCIRCYCCQELCPFDAVELKKTFMYRILHTFSHTRNKK